MPLQAASDTSSPMIIVFGSINVDLTFCPPHLPVVGETVLTPTFTQAVGGRGANQAIAAARDGARVGFIVGAMPSFPTRQQIDAAIPGSECAVEPDSER